jgi:hypothetical protein
MEAVTTPAALDPRGPSIFRPSMRAVLALVAYLPLAFLVTLAAGDLGDVGFWFVWIPVVAILAYLPIAGLVRLADRLKQR